MFTQVQHGTEQYDQTVALRDEVLRRPLGLTFTREELAGESDSFHLACRHENKVAACLVLKPLADRQLRMRQLAVREDCRCRGIGRTLVRDAESFAMDRGYEEIVLHARESVVGFYRKMGYKVEGERFMEVTIPHVRMRKRLLKKRDRSPHQA